MSQISLNGAGITAMRHHLVSFIFAVVAFSAGPMSHADQFNYEALVTGGTGALASLVPVDSTLNGTIDIDVVAGGTVTSTDALTAARLIMTNTTTGNDIFCFNFNETCPVTGPAEVPIVSVDDVDLVINGAGCPTEGTLGITAFSMTLNVNVPITLDFTNGTFLADAGFLGTSIGTGDFLCDSVTTAPEIEPSPDPATTLTFDDVIVGDPAVTEIITISNIGDANLNVGTVALAGDAGFTFEAGGDQCSNSAIAPMGSCTITTTFTATAAGAPTATITIPSDDVDEPSVVYNLAITVGLPPGEISSDGPLVIADTVINQTMSGTITVTNLSLGPLMINQIPPLTAPFSIISDLCSTMSLNSMETCEITVAFAPTMAGDFMGTLDIPSDDPVTGNLLVDISSTVLVPMLSASPDPLTIADTMVNDMMSADLTITNDGDADLTISGFTGLMVPFVIGAEDCTGGALAPMGTCVVTVEFSPTAEGDFTGNLSIASDDPNAPTVVAVNATGTEELLPDIMLDSMALTFSSLLLGQSEDMMVSVSNMGTADLTLNGIAIAPGGEFTSTDDCPAVLAPAQSCTVTVTFAPTAAGMPSATLSVTSDDPDTASADVTLSGVAILPLPEITVSDSILDVGVATIGDSATATVTVTNDGTADLTISSVTIPVGEYTQTNDCAVLIPTATCTVTVTFAPTVAGTVNDVLTIVSDDADEMISTVMLIAQSVLAPEPNIISDVDALDLGSLLFDDSAMGDITITNNGNAELNISAVTIAGADAGDFSSSDDCIGVVALNASCTISVTFTAAAPEGDKAATLSVASDDPSNASIDIALTGTSVMPLPELELSSATLIFANTVVGEIAMGSITVTNIGQGDLIVTGVGDTDAVDAPFALTSETCTAAPIATNGTCQLNFEYAPTALADSMDTFNLDSNDANPSRLLSLEGSALAAPEPDISVDVMALDLGSVLFNESSLMTVTVTNNGDADLTIGSTDIAPVGDFTAASDCAVLAPAATCTIDLTFAPTEQGDASAVLTITSDDPDAPALDVALSGIGIMPEAEIAVSPLSVDFGSVVAGESASGSVEVSNSGNANLIIGAIALGGTNVADFSQTNDCMTVAPGGSCTIMLSYAPASAGASNAELTIDSNDADEASVVVALTGMATPIPMPMIVVSPALDLGDVVVAQSAMADLDVTNSGTAALNISSVTLAGANSSDYSQTNDCMAVAAGASCTVTVTFSPAAVGASMAELTIASDDAATPSSVVSLTGNGLAEPMPMASIDVASVDFGGIMLGESATQDFIITNNGDADLTVDSIAVSGANAADFSAPNTCATVAPGASCTVTVSYTPSGAGMVEAMIDVVTNDPALPMASLAINASGAEMEEVVVTVSSGGNASGAFGLIELIALIGFAALIRGRKYLPVIGLLAVMPAAYAQDQTNWYVGFAYGSSDGQADIGEITQNLQSIGVDVVGLSIDDSDDGAKVFIGYQATDRLAFELAYVNLGEADIDGQFGDVTLEQLPLISRTVSENLSLLGDGYMGSAILKQPFMDNFSVYGKIGMISWEVDSQIGGATSADALAINETESGTDFTYGVGAEFHIADRFAIRGEWERYQLGDQDAELLSLGAYIKF